MIRREPKATENQVTRFPPGRTPRSGKGCTGRSADMKLHCQSDRQTAACFTLVHLPGYYQPLPPLTRSPSPCKQGEASFYACGPFRPEGTQGLATCSLFAKGDARVGAARSFPSHILKKIIFLLFLKIPCILEISSTKKAPALRPVLFYYICTATDGSSVSTVSSLFLISLSFFTILYRPTVRRGTRSRTIIA